MMKSLILISVALGSSSLAQAWGGRGHHLICEVASFLVQEKQLNQFLRTRAHVMGHLCNVPDTQWRNGPAEQTQAGNSAHYVDLELLQNDVDSLPADFRLLLQKYSGQKNQHDGKPFKDIHKEFGSNWWRAQQLYQRALSQKNKEQNDEAIFAALVNLGVMGHFVGDNAQPLHLTIDYDGWKSGHGGLHSFYEDQVVGALDYGFHQKLYKEALKLQVAAKMNQTKNKNEKAASAQSSDWFLRGSVFDRMRNLGKLSFADVPELFKRDRVLAKSDLKEEKGMQLKTPAKRKPAADCVKDFEPLIVKNMARAAVLLAQFWDEAYVELGRPDLTQYKSYKYPSEVEFVMPDYLN